MNSIHGHPLAKIISPVSGIKLVFKLIRSLGLQEVTYTATLVTLINSTDTEQTS